LSLQLWQMEQSSRRSSISKVTSGGQKIKNELSYYTVPFLHGFTVSLYF
jgi:hypothetical protein